MSQGLVSPVGSEELAWGRQEKGVVRAPFEGQAGRLNVAGEGNEVILKISPG